MSSKVQMIKGDTNPVVFCAKLTEIADEIENMACVVQYKNGNTKTFSTAMKNGDLAWLHWCFDQDFRPDMPGD